MGSTYEKKRHEMALLLVLGLVLIQPFAMAISIIPRLPWQVHVVNGLSNNGTLFVHCKSKDDDLGFHHLVGFGSEVNWGFKINFLGTTLYWCYLEKQNNGDHVEFEAFWVEKRHLWLEYRCHERNCIWIAKDDGVYLRNNPDNIEGLQHKWEVKLI